MRQRYWLVLAAVAALLGGLFAASAPPAHAATPHITSISPSTGPAGTQVTITGTDLNDMYSYVAFDTYAATNVSVSPTQVVVTAPTGPTGATSLKVSTATGHSNTVPFTYSGSSTTTPPPPPSNGPPTISSLSPSSGPAGTSVTVTGTNFTSASVTFGGYPADSVVVNSSTELVAVAPQNVTGTVDVRVSTGYGHAYSPYTFTAANYYPVTVGPGTSIMTEEGPFAGGSWCNIAAVGRDDLNRLVAVTAGHCNTQHDVHQPVYWSPTVERPKVLIGTFETINSHPEYVGSYPLNSQMDYAIILLDENLVTPINTTPTGQVFDHISTAPVTPGTTLMSKYGQVSGWVADCPIVAFENNVVYSSGCGNLPGDSGGGVSIGDTGAFAGVNSGTDPFAAGGRNNIFTHISGILADLADQGPNTVGIGFEPLP